MAEMEEAQIYEAFGLEQPAEEAAQEQVEEAENQEEPAAGEPVEDNEEPVEAEEESAGDGGETGKKPLTTEERRRNAERRRQKEQADHQAAIDQAVAAAREEEQKKSWDAMTDFFARAGLKNTITGEPITSLEDFNSWNEEFQRKKMERKLKAGELELEDLDAYIAQHPAVRKAQSPIEQHDFGRQEQSLIELQNYARQAEEQAKVKAQVDKEIAEIHKIDASINSVEDLFKAEYGAQLSDMVRRGYTITDAHYLLNRDKIEQARTKAAASAAEAKSRGKAHLQGTGGQIGGGAKSVSREEMAAFRIFMPKASDAEIEAWYNKNNK